MELEHLDISINRVEQRNEKIYYIILVHYKDLKYEISKRYSEFEELHCELLHMGFSALPNLPKKKFMSYKNNEYINYRKKVLNSYIQNLFMRPDIRCCALFLNFLLFYDKINLSVEIVRTKLLNSIGSQKFALSDLYINEKYNFIICVYEDKSNLSKLGKLWSIIEPDIIGEIKVFSYNNDLTSTLCETYKEQTIYKARNIVCSESQSEAIISGDDGKIHIYKIDTQLLTLTYIKNISCHNDTILKMMAINDNIFCTCGYDNAFRLLRLQDYKILSGGRCNKRLDKDKITTCHLLNHNNIVIGTNCSLFFTYNMSTNPPIYLDTKKLKNGEKIACFTNTDKYLFIGYDNVIACYNYHYSNDIKNGKNGLVLNEPFAHSCNPSHETFIQGAHVDGHNMYIGNDADPSINTTNRNVSRMMNVSMNENMEKNEQPITKLIIDNNMSAQYIPPLLYDNSVLSLSVNKEKKILYAGYEDAIIIWSITSGLIISAIHGHTNGVHFLKFMNSSDFLISGGDGGNLKIWKSDIDNFKIWKPTRKSYKTNEVNWSRTQRIDERGNVDAQKNSAYRVYGESAQHHTNYQNSFNFNFNESDNSEEQDIRSNTQSESMSIDNLLGETNKKYDYQVYDTSNYKKNLINYNESTNVNSVNSSRSNIFYDKCANNAPNELTSDTSNLDICVLTNEEDKKKSTSYDHNMDINFNKGNNFFETPPYYGYDSYQNYSHQHAPTENTNYDNVSSEHVRSGYQPYYQKNISNHIQQTDSDYLSDVHRDLSHETDPYTMGAHGTISNIALPHESLHNFDLNKINSINMNANTSSTTNNNHNQDDNSSKLEKNIIYVSDEDEDLISAFR
ncbi:WD domain, G-beta repeat domain containing protein [Plasmodium gonderi]|uniref:WD domain, G-beta repeat domain containing protein n=1 Tax=Plasmodium gonderi TaxID=77519 RepID=A0A1Y1JEL4_PLAGO|nr:WD domain, G-beta repeat domain containing protein [Plasmodium gonderi]GAW78883.1 WD domain, G-beta repeat domain containing protein [Plasmodium gonderi]